MKEKIKIKVIVKASIQKAWEYWNNADHIIHWNFADPSWHCPSASNDLRPGGKFSYRMEARDGSMGFDFYGEYKEVANPYSVEFEMGDGRMVWITFTEENGQTIVEQTFEAEDQNSIEMQKQGWKMIMNNYKNYTENH